MVAPLQADEFSDVHPGRQFKLGLSRRREVRLPFPKMAQLHLICGLPGAGKTTLARRLDVELPALRLSPEEWLIRIHASRSAPTTRRRDVSLDDAEETKDQVDDQDRDD